MKSTPDENEGEPGLIEMAGQNATVRRFAVLHRDGSATVLAPGRTMEDAEGERRACDIGERDLLKLSAIGEVEIMVHRVIEVARPNSAPETCPTCGQPHQ